MICSPTKNTFMAHVSDDSKRAHLFVLFLFSSLRRKQPVRLDGERHEADRQLHLLLPHPLAAALHGAQTPTAETRTHRNSDWRKL